MSICRHIVIALLISLLAGCILTPKQHNIQVMTTSQWEGHYYDVCSLTNAMNSVTLTPGESVWVLRNTTMKQILKNLEVNNK